MPAQTRASPAFWAPRSLRPSVGDRYGLGSAFTEEGTIASNEDHSARVYVAFDKETLLIGALITDDHVVAQFRKGDMWQGDMLEIIVPRPEG